MTSQLFESASLEDALAEVRDTVGPHAKIVRAEKVRRGGIAGFFAKESFVLAVEHDGSTPATPSPLAVAATRAVPVQRALPVVQAVPSTKPAQSDTWNDPYQDRFSAPMDTPAAYSLAALADFADRSDEVVDSQSHSGTETPVSTETPLFGQVLRDVSRATAFDQDESFRSVMPLVSAPTAPGTPPSAKTFPPAVPYFQEQVSVVAAVADDLSDWDSPVQAYQATPPQQPWWQTLAAVAETQAAHLAASEDGYPELPPAPALIDLSTPRPTPPPPQMPAPLDDRLGDALFAPAAPVTPEPVSAESVSPDSNAVAEPVVIVRPMPTAQKSVPSHQSTADLAAGLATINAALGPALLPGSVIAVVGHPADANKVAARVAVAASADPFAIHIASQDTVALQKSGLPTGRQVATLDEAILRSRRWPSRPTPLVVVVDGRDSKWARTVLDAIEATTVLALPSPAHNDDEVRDWVAELGGVQALLVDDTCASTPEALALHGIPALRSPWSLETTRRVGDQ